MCENYCGDNVPINFDQYLLEDQFKDWLTDPKITSTIQEIKRSFRKFSKFIKFWHVNCISVPFHKDEIRRVVDEIGLDILAVSETNIHKNPPKRFFKIPNYKFFHQDRTGGVDRDGCMYIKKKS